MYSYLQMAVELTSRGYISLNTKVNKQCIFIDSLHYIFLTTSFDNLQREKKYRELLLLASSQLANFLKLVFLVLVTFRYNFYKTVIYATCRWHYLFTSGKFACTNAT